MSGRENRSNIRNGKVSFSSHPDEGREVFSYEYSQTQHLDCGRESATRPFPFLFYQKTGMG